MVFSSAIFLFLFLPIVFIAYRLTPGLKVQNVLLIIASLFFYSFGNLAYFPLLLLSVGINYTAGLLVASPGKKRKVALMGAIVLNLGILAVFKYLDFLIGNLNLLPGIEISTPGIILPIGISFFTFQGMSYVIDVYRQPESGTKSFAKVLLYISFFPQLVAGPIIKYLDVAEQIDHRICTPEQTAIGIRRFILGLSKKLLIANTLGQAADSVYALSGSQLDIRLAWLGAICYTLQIYFDFSGYSDMAIGLGKMFGFNFKENFRHPYASGSVKDFWRRWHISLSSWFKEYLYIPLGGNRRGAVRARLNRLIVFFFTGLWHGASWTFVLWGLWHGFFLMLEDRFRPHKLQKGTIILGHFITLLVVVLGFVLFRAENLAQAGAMLKAMFTGLAFTLETEATFANLCSLSLVITLGVAVICSLPVLEWAKKLLAGRNQQLVQNLTWVISLGLLVLNILNLASTSFNPFIYFQF